jgi:hypothetical protein
VTSTQVQHLLGGSARDIHTSMKVTRYEQGPRKIHHSICDALIVAYRFSAKF